MEKENRVIVCTTPGEMEMDGVCTFVYQGWDEEICALAAMIDGLNGKGEDIWYRDLMKECVDEVKYCEVAVPVEAYIEHYDDYQGDSDSWIWDYWEDIDQDIANAKVANVLFLSVKFAIDNKVTKMTHKKMISELIEILGGDYEKLAKDLSDLERQRADNYELVDIDEIEIEEEEED